MENDKTFELMTKMYADLKEGQDELNKRLDGVDKKLDTKADKSDIVRMENTITPKIEALFDGYKQNTEQLIRIEDEVSKHEEVILKRVK